MAEANTEAAERVREKFWTEVHSARPMCAERISFDSAIVIFAQDSIAIRTREICACARVRRNQKHLMANRMPRRSGSKAWKRDSFHVLQ
jgi:hypothetical protein